MSKENDPPIFALPKQQGFCETLLQFIYNPNEGSYMGRTPRAWGQLLLFYVVLYALLAGLFAVSLRVFLLTVDPKIPKWTLDKSIIGTNPGLGFRPRPPIENVHSTLIYYKGTSDENFAHWVQNLANITSFYQKQGDAVGRGQNIYNCDFEHYPPAGKVCNVNVREWAPCTKENKFNYHVSAPCVFLTLNRIYGWKPEFYNNTADLPREMPEQLKEHIRYIAATAPNQLNTVWVSCEGENPADKENLGFIRFPSKFHGFPGYYFPYLNSEGYLSPIVPIYFDKPTNGILINILCKAWAKNIEHNSKERMGMVHFELMID